MKKPAVFIAITLLGINSDSVGASIILSNGGIPNVGYRPGPIASLLPKSQFTLVELAPRGPPRIS